MRISPVERSRIGTGVTLSLRGNSRNALYFMRITSGHLQYEYRILGTPLDCREMPVGKTCQNCHNPLCGLAIPLFGNALAALTR